jgi:phosphotransferase system enzyme I (PtsP)
MPSRITSEALNGDHILVDGDQGVVHLRPEETVARAFRDKIAMQAEAQKRYASLARPAGHHALRHHHLACT